MTNPIVGRLDLLNIWGQLRAGLPTVPVCGSVRRPATAIYHYLLRRYLRFRIAYSVFNARDTQYAIRNTFAVEALHA